MPLQSYVKQLRPRDETYVPHVDKIQVIKETYKQAAYDMEKVIVSAAGGPPLADSNGEQGG